MFVWFFIFIFPCNTYSSGPHIISDLFISSEFMSQLVIILFTTMLIYTWSRPRSPLRSHSLLCIENNLFIVGVGKIINKELASIFRSDCSDCTCVNRYISVLYNKFYR